MKVANNLCKNIYKRYPEIFLVRPTPLLHYVYKHQAIQLNLLKIMNEGVAYFFEVC